jgi:hypothetical protein
VNPIGSPIDWCQGVYKRVPLCARLHFSAVNRTSNHMGACESSQVTSLASKEAYRMVSGLSSRRGAGVNGTCVQPAVPAPSQDAVSAAPPPPLPPQPAQPAQPVTPAPAVEGAPASGAPPLPPVPGTVSTAAVPVPHVYNTVKPRDVSAAAPSSSNYGQYGQYGRYMAVRPRAALRIFACRS